MAHEIRNQQWVGPEGDQRLVIWTQREILTRDRMSGRLAAVTEEYVTWLGSGGHGSHPRSSIRGFYHNEDLIAKQYDQLAAGQQPVANPPAQAVPQPQAMVERPIGTGANQPQPVQPPNCTCPFPDMVAPNGNGHHPACPAFGPPVTGAPPPPPPVPLSPPPALPPRDALPDERDQLAQAIALTSEEVPYEILAEDIIQARVAVFEDFFVKGTGKIGHVAVIVWPDGPDHVNTLVRDPRGAWTKLI